MKRKPLLIDMYLAQGDDHLIAPKTAKRLRGIMEDPQAKKFVLDAAGARYFGEMCRDCPEVIARGQDFAIPPFKQMWIEMPYVEFYKILTGLDPDATSDQVVGYLIDWPTVYCLSGADRRVEGRSQLPISTGVLPLAYQMNQPLSAADEISLCQQMQCSRLELDLFYWGTTAHKLLGFPTSDIGKPLAVAERDWTPEQTALMRSLRANHSFKNISDSLELKKLWNTFYKGSAGDLKNILGLLIFLNQTSMVRYEEEVGFAQGMIGNKTARLFKHRVVTLKLNPVADIRRRILKPYVPSQYKRLHDVRGHFCHDYTARTEECAHDWLEHGVNRWRCLACGGKRWWRKEHERGKKKLGRVVTEYAVTE